MIVKNQPLISFFFIQKLFRHSTHRDTIRSEKKYYSYQKAPKMLHGSWYVFVTLAIAVIAVLVLKR